MTNDLEQTLTEQTQPKIVSQGGSGGTVYGLGLIGAWVFYIGRATTTQERIIGFFKGLVWPAFLVHDALTYLHKG